MSSKVFALIACAGAAASAFGDLVSIGVVAKEGDGLDGAVITGFSQPFVNGLGTVGFNAILDDGSRAVWYGNGSIFNSSSALPDVLTGSESNMGISNTGGFIYSPSVNGNDAVYTHEGPLLVEGVAAPGIPGFFNSFNSRPRMLNNGEAVWVGGFASTSGGSSIGRVMYRADPSDTGSITPVFRTGDLVDGLAIGTTGVGFDYDFSGNGAHHIHNLLVDSGSTLDDGRIWVDGVVVAAENSPNGQGDNWDNFKSSSINNSGNYVFAGDTDGATTTDDFMAYNGSIQIRQGDVIDGLTLTGAFDACAINDLNEAVFIADSSLTETLFWASDAAALSSALAILSVGDEVDVDGDLIADYTLTDFNASTIASQGMDFANDGLLYISVDLRDDAGATVEAIISVAVPAPAGLGVLAGFALAARRRRR